MFKQEFIQLISQPKNELRSKTEQLMAFEALVKEYPFFQSAHLLYTKGLHNTNSLSYTKQLRKTAIVANSRAVLYELIHQKEVGSPTLPTSTIAEDKNVSVNPVKDTLAVEPVDIKGKQSTVSITSDEIKIVYVNTIPAITPKVEIKETTNLTHKDAVIELNNSIQESSAIEPESPNNELNILKDVENETSESVVNDNASVVSAVEISTKEKIHTQIETEISRGIIQSYVETDIIKTPQLNKEKIEEPLTFTAWLEKVKKESHTIQKTGFDTSKPLEKESGQGSATTINSTLSGADNNQLSNNKASSASTSNNEKTTDLSNDFKQRKDIINKIIDLDPGRIKLGNQKFFTPQADAKQSLLENEHLVTETLAKIYALQGNNAKAIRAYEILSLKFPQKSVYFTSLIEKLKTNK